MNALDLLRGRCERKDLQPLGASSYSSYNITKIKSNPPLPPYQNPDRSQFCLDRHIPSTYIHLLAEATKAVLLEGLPTSSPTLTMVSWAGTHHLGFPGVVTSPFVFLKGLVWNRVDAPQAFCPLAVNYKELLPAAAKEFKTGDRHL